MSDMNEIDKSKQLLEGLRRFTETKSKSTGPDMQTAHQQISNDLNNNMFGQGLNSENKQVHLTEKFFSTNCSTHNTGAFFLNNLNLDLSPCVTRDILFQPVGSKLNSGNILDNSKFLVLNNNNFLTNSNNSLNSNIQNLQLLNESNRHRNNSSLIAPSILRFDNSLNEIINLNNINLSGNNNNILSNGNSRLNAFSISSLSEIFGNNVNFNLDSSKAFSGLKLNVDDLSKSGFSDKFNFNQMMDFENRLPNMTSNFFNINNQNKVDAGNNYPGSKTNFSTKSYEINDILPNSKDVNMMNLAKNLRDTQQTQANLQNQIKHINMQNQQILQNQHALLQFHQSPERSAMTSNKPEAKRNYSKFRIEKVEGLQDINFADYIRKSCQISRKKPEQRNGDFFKPILEETKTDEKNRLSETPTHSPPFLGKKKIRKDSEFMYHCSHPDCSASFKTKKQRILHHNKLDCECKVEKQSIIKLIAKYKKGILQLTKINGNEENIKLLDNLKIDYEKTQSKIADIDYFKSTVGESFNDL